MQFGGLIAVNDLTLFADQKEIVALIGPNGAGKTTAFNMITGVYKPTSGHIALNKQNITGMRPDRITRLGMARTFQNIRLFKSLPVLDNVVIAEHLRIKSNWLGSTLRLPLYNKENRLMYERAEQLLEHMGLKDVIHETASSLPYGMQRKLEIARAIATQPVMLLLDEPAAGMNPAESMELTQLIQSVRDEFDLTILLIEHHMDVVMDISDRIYVLDYGNLIAVGTPSEIQANDIVIKAYLGVSEDEA
jgi:branched-chain amino acid transport system ATP-binding protein